MVAVADLAAYVAGLVEVVVVVDSVAPAVELEVVVVFVVVAAAVEQVAVVVVVVAEGFVGSVAAFAVVAVAGVFVVLVPASVVQNLPAHVDSLPGFVASARQDASVPLLPAPV